MLFPDAYAIWLVSFLLVVATRNFFTPFLPLTAIMVTLTWESSNVALGTDADMANHVVRRLSYMLYGAIAGFAVSAAVGTRVIIPVHTFSGKNPHWAGLLSVVSVSFIPYALAVAVGWADPFEEWTGNGAGRVVFYTILFIALVGVLASILITSWKGIHKCPMAYRYSDSGFYAAGHPPSRYAAEAVLVLTLLVSPLLIWIFTSHAPVSWPQFIGGIIALGVQAIMWVAVWRLGDKRYDMEGTHFGTDHAWVSWANFVTVVATVHLASQVVWIIVAEFSTTGLSAEVTLIFTTLGVFVIATLAWLFMTPTFSTRSPQQNGRQAARRRPLPSSSRRDASVRAPLSEEDRQKRIADLL